MNRSNQKGIALILTLILVFVLTVMGVSLMFISQTETWSSLNYRLMSQSRDGAEAGINSAANYIVNTYTEPGGAGDPTTAYLTTVSPVQYPLVGGSPVILSAMNSQASNYPASTGVQSAFNTTGVGKGSIAAGSTTVNYNTYATLLSMPPTFKPFGSTSNTTVQTWQIVSEGTISGVRASKVQVSAILEQHRTPTFNYAAFATDPGCSALQFGGGGTTDSYDDTAALSGGFPVASATYGNVGTNGNLATNGNPTTINGTLSTPRTGVGTCTAGNITAWTTASGHVTGGLVELPQSVVYPTPVIPPPGTVDVTTNTSCPLAATMLTTGGTCLAGTGACASNTMCIGPIAANGTVNLHTLSLTGNRDLHLAAGTYNIDSITETGSTALVLDSIPVILNVTGSGGGDVVKLTGGGLTNTTGNFDPQSFQVLYAGTGNVSLKGGTAAVGLLYAPNAAFSFAGGSNWYGAVIGKDMTDMGGTAVHYDRRLQNEGFTVGPWMLDSFTWKKY